MEKQTNINDLYFGIKLFPLSYSSRDKLKELTTYNLFSFGRVKWSVARYVTMSEKEKKSLLSGDPLLFCFGDVWSRTEFEFIACPWPYTDEMTISNSGVKVDTFEMYVKPNADLLMKMVNSVSVSSAKKYLAEERKRSKGQI